MTKSKNMKNWNSLPKKVQEKMLNEQFLQNGKKDESIFIEDIRAYHEGFDWHISKDGYDYWRNILNKNIIPEEFKEHTYPKLMEVSGYSDFTLSSKRVVFMEKNGKYIAWNGAESLKESKKVYSTTDWNYARDIKQITLTKQEIADKFGVEVDNLVIL